MNSEADRDAFDKLLPTLPDPITLETVLSELRQNFQQFPSAMLGEVGIDRSFRVPLDPSARPRQLTPFRIPFEHQLAVLEAQLDLAVELRRNVSLHSVNCQKHTIQLFERMAQRHSDNWAHINIDIHSCSLSVATWKTLEVCSITMTYLEYSRVYSGKTFKCILLTFHDH
jgi:Tat protein secretion system quality control protein TatD with DNase activity